MSSPLCPPTGNGGKKILGPAVEQLSNISRMTAREIALCLTANLDDNALDRKQHDSNLGDLPNSSALDAPSTSTAPATNEFGDDAVKQVRRQDRSHGQKHTTTPREVRRLHHNEVIHRLVKTVQRCARRSVYG